jgi:hypothetical protein
MSDVDSDIGAVVICDDVRRELNGKDILVGVYGGEIIVAQLPFTLNLAIWCEYRTPRDGTNNVYVRISYNSQKRGEFRLSVEAPALSLMALPFPQFLLSSDSIGELLLEYSRDGSAWAPIKRKKVVTGTVQSIFSAPPTRGT